MFFFLSFLPLSSSRQCAVLRLRSETMCNTIARIRFRPTDRPTNRPTDWLTDPIEPVRIIQQAPRGSHDRNGLLAWHDVIHILCYYIHARPGWVGGGKQSNTKCSPPHPGPGRRHQVFFLAISPKTERPWASWRRRNGWKDDHGPWGLQPCSLAFFFLVPEMDRWSSFLFPRVFGNSRACRLHPLGRNI